MKFRKKPVVVEAIRWTGKNCDEIAEFLRGVLLERLGFIIQDAPFTIVTLEGNHRADIGDWIIKGVKGEFYPCKPDIFEQTYEQVESDIEL